MEQPDQETTDRWHRRFAVDCNNRSWDLASQPSRSETERREMVLAAYTAAFHWSKIGKPVNNMRAELLLSHVHAILGDGDEAVGYAVRCLSFCKAEECEDWDLAFAHSHMAMAAAVVGDADLHAHHYAEAKRLGGEIEDEGDRTVFLDEFKRIPAPS